MELRHLRYFVAVAEELHFGRAALRLAIVQPSLSQQIQQLEEELGFPLLRRTRRSVELTEAGRVFLGAARNILFQVQEARLAARRAYRGEVGRLVIGYISSSTYDLLPTILSAYREHYPHIEVVLRELTTQEQVRDLEEERIHVGLLRLPISAPLLEFVVVREEPIVCVLPEGHYLAQEERIAVAQLAHEPFVLQASQRGTGYFLQLMQMCLAAGFTPEITQEVTQMHAIVGLVAAGIGISLVPLSTRKMRNQGVVYRELEGPPALTRMAIAWARNTDSATIENFLEVVRDITPDLA